jgi:PadR family transcriptional regulator, regulatory protein AphA
VSLPHVLLGLLRETPRSGYELARAMREEIDPAWNAAFSQIYPALARLRRRGWVLLRVLGPRHGPPRLLYRVTASGRTELRRWLHEPAPPTRRNDAGLARLAFLDALTLPERRRVLLAFEAAVSAEITQLRQTPLPDGYRGFARRAGIEQRDALRRFLRSGGARPASVESPVPRKKR